MIDLKGYIHYNRQVDQFQVFSWLEEDSNIIKTGLDAMNIQLYSKEGVALSYNENAITPNAIGLFTSAEVDNPDFLTIGEAYVMYFETEYNGSTYSTYVPFNILKF